MIKRFASLKACLLVAGGRENCNLWIRLCSNESLISSGDASFVHPSLKVVLVEGKGRGVLANDQIKLGELLMRIPPLAWLKSSAENSKDEDDHDQGPDPLSLVPMLMNGSSTRTMSWLQVLSHSKGKGEPKVAIPIDQLNELFSSDHALIPSAPAPIDASRVESVVLSNAFGDRFEDPVLSSLTTASPRPPLAPFVGLWPQFSLINHSCLPKAVHYATSGGTLIVRASTDLRQGEEVTISYLGEDDFSPVAMRQEALGRRFGFRCDCPRCRLEESLPPSLTNLLHRIHKNIKRKLMPSFQSAVEEDDPVKLAALSSDLEEESISLYEGLHEFIKSDLSRSFSDELDVEPYLLLEAAVYELFQLIAVRDEIAGADRTSSIQSCLDILGAVSRGSEVECFLSSRLLFSLLRRKRTIRELAVEDEDGEGKESTLLPRNEASMDKAIQQAGLACELSHRARYGSMKKEMLLKMMRLSDEVGREYL